MRPKVPALKTTTFGMDCIHISSNLPDEVRKAATLTVFLQKSENFAVFNFCNLNNVCYICIHLCYFVPSEILVKIIVLLFNPKQK